MDEIEFSINDDTYTELVKFKKTSGFENKNWDEWFQYICKSSSDNNQNVGEKVANRFFQQKDFKLWVSNFARNLEHIWHESSTKELAPKTNSNDEFSQNSAIVIGRGPSLQKNNHLEILSKSNFGGAIVCTDGVLKTVLNSGVTPDKFPKFYVVTIDAYKEISELYDDKIIEKYGSKINGIFSTLTHPNAVAIARKSKIKIHWVHPLFDYNEGEKSFNNISALMVRVKNHSDGLPAIQTGGNSGTSSWFFSWRILRCSTVCLIGIDHGWSENDSIEKIISHGNMFKAPSIDVNKPLFHKLFPKIYNPEFKTNCILDPIFQYYSSALKEFIFRSPASIRTINATEGGSIFGRRITCMKFKEFLEKYEK